MKKHLPLSFLLFLFFVNKVCGQSELSNFTSTGRGGIATSLLTDYQCLGVNPANLAFLPMFENKNYTIGFGEVGFSAYTQALNRNPFLKSLRNPGTKLTNAEKRASAQAFANAPLSINLDVLVAGFSWQENVGGNGFAFSIREKFQWYSKFNPRTSDILFNGYNANYFNIIDTTIIDTSNGQVRIDTLGGIAKITDSLSRILDGTRISLSWFREYNFGYGLSLVNTEKLRISLGVGGRFIQGIGIMDLRASPGKLDAFISASPSFGINFGQSNSSNPSIDTTNLGFIPNAVGNGAGFDFGFSTEVEENLKIGFSFNNLGSIVYKGNVYTASDAPLRSLKTRGFNNFNFFREAEQFDGLTKEFIKWKGLKSIRKPLPSTFRIGGNYRWAELVNVGIDMVFPMNDVSGNLIAPSYAVGVDITLTNWLRLSSGFSRGGNFGRSLLMPAGFIMSVRNGLWEFGFSVRDCITYLRAKNPVLSASFGFLRFRW